MKHAQGDLMDSSSSMTGSEEERGDAGLDSRHSDMGEGKNSTQVIDFDYINSLSSRPSSGDVEDEPGREVMEGGRQEAEKVIAIGKLLGLSFEMPELEIVKNAMALEAVEDDGLLDAGGGLGLNSKEKGNVVGC